MATSFRIHVNSLSQFIKLGYRLNDRGIGVRFMEARDFLFFTTFRPALRPTQSSIQWVPGAHSPGIKWPGEEADHSPPSSAKVKNGGAIPPLPHTSSWHCA
jgi:hypothetical protein